MSATDDREEAILLARRKQAEYYPHLPRVTLILLRDKMTPEQSQLVGAGWPSGRYRIINTSKPGDWRGCVFGFFDHLVSVWGEPLAEMWVERYCR